MTLTPASGELLALAAATRPDWDAGALSGAITAARNAGWDWRRVLAHTCRMLTDDKAEPRDLLKAVQNPLARTVPAPGTAERGAALAWRLLAESGPEEP